MGLRDVLLFMILLPLIPVAVARPFVGALVFAFLALNNPHRMVYGPAEDVPWSMIFGIATLVGMLFTKERRIGAGLVGYSPVLAYLAWACVTTAFALIPLEAEERLVSVLKVHVACLTTLMLLTTMKRARILLTVLVVAIGYYGVKGGAFTIVTGGSERVWGPPSSAIYDNNHLATGLVITLPLLFWLLGETTRRWQRWAIMGTIALSVVSVLGAHSRGSFMALCAAALFVGLRSSRKFATVVALGALLVAAGFFMPDKFWDRIETIGTYNEDMSAQQRLNSWRGAINVANDRITGGGYEYYGPEASAKYTERPDWVVASHSIYFQAIGEQGWIGLVLYLAIWVNVVWRLWRITRSPDTDPEAQSAKRFARLMQASLVGFFVGGALYNIGNWDMMFYLLAVTVAFDQALRERRSRSTETTRDWRPKGPSPAKRAISPQPAPE